MARFLYCGKPNNIKSDNYTYPQGTTKAGQVILKSILTVFGEGEKVQISIEGNPTLEDLKLDTSKEYLFPVTSFVKFGIKKDGSGQAYGILNLTLEKEKPITLLK